MCFKVEDVIIISTEEWNLSYIPIHLEIVIARTTEELTGEANTIGNAGNVSNAVERFSSFNVTNKELIITRLAIGLNRCTRIIADEQVISSAAIYLNPFSRIVVNSVVLIDAVGWSITHDRARCCIHTHFSVFINLADQNLDVQSLKVAESAHVGLMFYVTTQHIIHVEKEYVSQIIGTFDLNQIDYRIVRATVSYKHTTAWSRKLTFHYDMVNIATAFQLTATRYGNRGRTFPSIQFSPLGKVFHPEDIYLIATR